MRLACLVTAALFLVGLAGCGGDGLVLVPVSGRVLIDGAPLTYGHVRFVPDDARPSGGHLDKDGRFKLTYSDGRDGAVLGRHRVEIFAAEVQGGAMHWHAPKEYRSFETSGLETTIDGEIDSVELNLTWKGAQPFNEAIEQE